LSWGGAERVAVNLSQRFSKRGHEVHVITAASDTPIEGINLHILKIKRLFSPWKIISFQRKVRQIIKNGKYDIVYSLCQVYPVDIYRVGGGIHGYWMRLQYPTPVFRWMKYLTSLVHLAMVYLEKQIFKEGNCKFFITNSKLIKNHVMEYFHIPEGKIKVIYNGIDNTIFNIGVKTYRKTMREKYQIHDDELVLLFVANNWERKGLSTIIEAMQKTDIKKIRLLIVGRGKMRRYLSLAKSKRIHPDKLIFVGHTGDIEKYYGMADIFILPSIYEPFSNVCLEAMACGLPVITTKSNGASELIASGENGFILDDWKDSDNLARIILRLNENTIREEMGNSAAKTAKNYTWERHIEKTSEIFTQFVNQDNH